MLARCPPDAMRHTRSMTQTTAVHAGRGLSWDGDALPAAVSLVRLKDDAGRAHHPSRAQVTLVPSHWDEVRFATTQLEHLLGSQGESRM